MIKENHGYHNCSDGNIIYLYKWLPKEPKAVLMIVHGMMEHAGRYSEVANFLSENEIAVYVPDLRGHGKSLKNKSLVGHFNKDDWNLILQDLTGLLGQIKQDHPQLPCILLGHSMGSLVARHLFAKTNHTGTIGRPKFKGLILSGVTNPSGPEILAGRLITGLLSIFRSSHHRSNLLAGLSYGKYNSQFKPERTAFDWLSENEENVSRYIEDPLSGRRPTLGFWNGFFNGIKELKVKEKEASLSPGTPVLIFYGKNDPVGRFGKDPKSVAENYCKKGLQELTVKIYEGARHEVMNESIRKSVYEDILNWTEDKIAR